MSDPAHTPHTTGPVAPVVIIVNDTAVTVPDNRVSGAQIKEAAIAAGVPITSAFVLFIETARGRELVRDDEVVKVNKNSVFEAITDDVNS